MRRMRPLHMCARFVSISPRGRSSGERWCGVAAATERSMGTGDLREHRLPGAESTAVHGWLRPQHASAMTTSTANTTRVPRCTAAAARVSKSPRTRRRPGRQLREGDMVGWSGCAPVSLGARRSRRRFVRALAFDCPCARRWRRTALGYARPSASPRDVSAAERVRRNDRRTRRSAARGLEGWTRWPVLNIAAVTRYRDTFTLA
jgi:hypothetical protein